MRLLHSLALITGIMGMTAATAAHAQLPSYAPSAPMHTPMPVPSTAAPPIAAPGGPALPELGPPPLAPQSPVAQAEPESPLHTGMPTPSSLPPPIVMEPPNLLSPSLLPPGIGIQPDSTTPTVPVPSGTPLGPPHP